MNSACKRNPRTVSRAACQQLKEEPSRRWFRLPFGQSSDHIPVVHSIDHNFPSPLGPPSRYHSQKFGHRDKKTLPGSKKASDSESSSPEETEFASVQKRRMRFQTSSADSTRPHALPSRRQLFFREWHPSRPNDFVPHPYKRKQLRNCKRFA